MRPFIAYEFKVKPSKFKVRRPATGDDIASGKLREAIEFAALPRTRGFDPPSTLVFIFVPMPPVLQRSSAS
jgi:hypothetical protein